MTISVNSRTAGHDIESLFLERWSPRAFTHEAITEEELMTLFEAARWAPSCYNSQPWRFVYACRASANWEPLLALLAPFNQGWAKNAASLIFVLSKLTMRPPGTQQDVPSRSHSFDAGAAWAFLALQATRMGLQAHAMAGVDFERAATSLQIPSDFRIEAAIAVGRPGDKAQLPDALRSREQPSPRNPLTDLVHEGRFRFPKDECSSP